jgi:hypothetical protein
MIASTPVPAERFAASTGADLMQGKIIKKRLTAVNLQGVRIKPLTVNGVTLHQIQFLSLG